MVVLEVSQRENGVSSIAHLVKFLVVSLLLKTSLIGNVEGMVVAKVPGSHEEGVANLLNLGMSPLCFG